MCAARASQEPFNWAIWIWLGGSCCCIHQSISTYGSGLDAFLKPFLTERLTTNLTKACSLHLEWVAVMVWGTSLAFERPESYAVVPFTRLQMALFGRDGSRSLVRSHVRQDFLHRPSPCAGTAADRGDTISRNAGESVTGWSNPPQSHRLHWVVAEKLSPLNSPFGRGSFQGWALPSLL